MCSEWRQCTPLGQALARDPRDRNALPSIVQRVQAIMGYSDRYEHKTGLQRVPCVNFPHSYLSFVKNRCV